MGDRNGSVVRRRQLARRLRQLREEAGLTLDCAAPKLDWSVSKLSRIETAQQAIDVHGVRSMLDLYDVGGDRWTEIIDLTREARQRGWWRAYGVGDDNYVGLETEASMVEEFAMGYLPGLLQTSAYSRALFETSLMPRTPDELENAVAVRTIRRERLVAETNPLTFVGIVEEHTLRRPIGGRDVQREQLHELLRLIELPTVTFQVLPASHGAHAALGSGFVLLSFGELDEPDVAFVEHTLGSVSLEKIAPVTRARIVFDRLRSDALNPADSAGAIQRVADSL